MAIQRITNACESFHSMFNARVILGTQNLHVCKEFEMGEMAITFVSTASKMVVPLKQTITKQKQELIQKKIM